MSLDRVPGAAELYIGALISLRRYEALKKANITHVVSVLRLPLDQDLFRQYQHHVIDVDDVEDENLLQHFPASNAFIEQGLRSGGGVLVHWKNTVFDSKFQNETQGASREAFAFLSRYQGVELSTAANLSCHLPLNIEHIKLSMEQIGHDLRHPVPEMILFISLWILALIQSSGLTVTSSDQNAMGKSRSASVIVAYLLSSSLAAAGRVSDPSSLTEDSSGPSMRQSSPSMEDPATDSKTPLDPKAALSLIRQVRAFAEPNAGFMTQLELYHRMGCPTNLDAHPEYQRWLYRRAVEESNSRGVAPDVDDIRFGDEVGHGPGRRGVPDDIPPNTVNQSSSSNPTSSSTSARLTPNVAYRCRRCRTQLATSGYTTGHTARTASTTSPSPATQPKQAATACAHIFFEPISWMRPELEQGNLSGRLECPNAKCKTVVGRYAWQGMRCTCGQWEVPGLSLARSKVDEIASRSAEPSARGKM